MYSIRRLACQPYFEAKFKKGAAADLKVSESDVVITAITVAARRRGLLATVGPPVWNNFETNR